VTANRILLAVILVLTMLTKSVKADTSSDFLKTLSPELQQFLRENDSASKYLAGILEVQLRVRAFTVIYTTNYFGSTACHVNKRPDLAEIWLSKGEEPLDEYLSLVYELLNSSHEEKFRNVREQASAKKISRRDFIREFIKIEQEAHLKLKADLRKLALSDKDIASSRQYELQLKMPDTFEEFYLGCKNVSDDWSPARDYSQMYDSLTGRNSDKAYAFVHEGSALTQDEKWDDAIKKLKTATDLNPEDAHAFYKLGWAYFKKGDTNTALEHLTHSIKLDDELARPYSLRAAVYESQGRYRDALIDHREAMRISPKEVRIRSWLAWTYLAMGDRTNAFAHFQAAINLDPKSPIGYNNRGSAYWQIGDWRNALNDYAQCYKVDPSEGINGLVNLAWLEACCPDPAFRNGPKAIADARKACDAIQWTNSTCLSTLAAAYAETTNFAEAIKWQEKSLKLGATMDTNSHGETPLQCYQSHRPWRLDNPTNRP
jgi:tetratricopeptide (TPR) repeat protein